MRAISDADCRHLPPRAKFNFAGGASDLESLKSGKDKTKLWCALKYRKRSGFTPRAEPPTAQFLARPCAFGTINLRHFPLVRTCAMRAPGGFSLTLHRPNRVRYYEL